MIPVILCGGSGTRLWPLSRSQYPKQFLALHSTHSLLQETLLRLGQPNQYSGQAESDQIDFAEAWLICNEAHRFLVAEQMRQIGQPCRIFLEPEGRNTAPAIALAALACQQQGRAEEPLLVLSSDHVIADAAAFRRAVREAQMLTEQGLLVTFGVVPTAPETGYGYIRRGEPLTPGYRVAGFVEKPDQATAQAYLAGGDYFWNSGMFMFTAQAYLQALEKFRPDILSACQQAMAKTQQDLDFTRVDSAAFAACPSDSIDYAVMEHTHQGAVVPLDAGWSDVGSWSALWDIHAKDEQGNVLQGDVLAQHSRNCLVLANERLVTTLGVDDLIIIDSKDALMVAHKDQVQQVKNLVEQLQQQGRPESQQHREVYRPWGKYDSVDSGARYQVKRISVKPGARLSLQKHHHRAEHWIVVKGTAQVTCGDRQYLVTENQSTYIPLGEVHCLENPGKLELELIEVQSGAYLGEDDIVRLQDNYGRATPADQEK